MAEYQLLFDARYLQGLQNAFDAITRAGGTSEYDGTPTTDFDELIQEGFNVACQCNGGVQHVELGLIPVYERAAAQTPTATINIITQVEPGSVPYINVT